MQQHNSSPSIWSQLTPNQILGILAFVVVMVIGGFLCLLVTISPMVFTATPTPDPLATASAEFTTTELPLPLASGTPSTPPAFPSQTPTLAAPVFSPTVTPLPAIDTMNMVVPTEVVDTSAQTGDFSAQSGGVVPTAVWPQPYITPTPLVIATQVAYQPTPSYGYQPTPEMVPPYPMPPLNVSNMVCGASHLYIGTVDPRIGCRMPQGTVIMSVEIWRNGQLLLGAANTSAWQSSNAVAVAQPGYILNWAARNNVGCVAWSPPATITVGMYDSISYRITSNTGEVATGVVGIYERYRAGNSIVNPFPIAHACGFSPDGTRLLADYGDTLSRFVLGYDLQLTEPVYTAWLNRHGSYNLIVGSVYDVPAEWLTQWVPPVTGK